MFGDMDGGYRHQLYVVNSVHTRTTIQWARWAPYVE